jgi:hypothetical protein
MLCVNIAFIGCQEFILGRFILASNVCHGRNFQYNGWYFFIRVQSSRCCCILTIMHVNINCWCLLEPACKRIYTHINSMAVNSSHDAQLLSIHPLLKSSGQSLQSPKPIWSLSASYASCVPSLPISYSPSWHFISPLSHWRRLHNPSPSLAFAELHHAEARHTILTDDEIRRAQDMPSYTMESSPCTARLALMTTWLA